MIIRFISFLQIFFQLFLFFLNFLQFLICFLSFFFNIYLFFSLFNWFFLLITQIFDFIFHLFDFIFQNFIFLLKFLDTLTQPIHIIYYIITYLFFTLFKQSSILKIFILFDLFKNWIIRQKLIIKGSLSYIAMNFLNKKHQIFIRNLLIF